MRTGAVLEHARRPLDPTRERLAAVRATEHGYPLGLVARWTEAQIAEILQAQRILPVPTVDGLSPRERWPELHQLLAGYLHQDYDLDGTAEDCVRTGVADLSAAQRETISAQLRQLRGRGLTENDVARALWDLGMEYLPYADDRTAVEWVDWITATVDATRDSPSE